MINLPKTRPDLLVQDLNDEVLIYDKSAEKSYCLNSTARTVFNACDGVKTFADVNLPEDIVYLSLDELKKQNLIEEGYISPFAGMNRREVIRKVGLASMIALPVISSLIAPDAANAASGRLASCAACTTNAQCSSNRCLQSNNASGQACGNSPTAQLAFQKGFSLCDSSNSDQSCSRFSPVYCCNGSATSGDPCGTSGDGTVYTCTCN